MRRATWALLPIPGAKRMRWSASRASVRAIYLRKFVALHGNRSEEALKAMEVNINIHLPVTVTNYRSCRIYKS